MWPSNKDIPLFVGVPVIMNHSENTVKLIDSFYNELLFINYKTALDRGPRSDRPHYHDHTHRTSPLPLVSQHELAADDGTMETYYYGHQSALIWYDC